MPVLLYVVSIIATVLFTSLGLTVLAVAAAIVAAVVLFRHELAVLKPKPFDFWRTDP